MDWQDFVQAAIALVVITSPPDPAKVLLFNTTIAEQNRPRTRSALFVATVVLGILVGAALVGRPILSLLGINLDAFQVVGGIVIAGMGFEMLYGGAPSRAQGRSEREKEPTGEEGLIIPLSTPLIAGPGANVTAITIASMDQAGAGIAAAVVGAVAVALVTFASFEWLGGIIAKMSPRATAIVIRLGGLLLATIGTQMVLGGLKNFFG